jgi:hypothetical protein
MKLFHVVKFASAAGLLAVMPLTAQRAPEVAPLVPEANNAGVAGFSSGSTGAYGPMNITANTTLDVPPDGIFHCTTINVSASRTLTFRKNALNTPVYLLATGDVTIAGTISLDGAAGNNVTGGESGPGGFNGGNPASISTPPGSGYGPGGGRGGLNANAAGGAGPGAHATIGNVASTNKGSIYGSALLIPLVGGSGGGGTTGTPGVGGGGGGGAILLASNTRIEITGTIEAEGGSNAGTGLAIGGSGGAVRLVAPVISGSGTVRVFGAASGGDGRIRVDTLNRTGIGLNFGPAAVTSVGSMMLVFPSPIPRLDIVEVAGTAVPLGSGPVFVNLPFGSLPNRQVKVRAQDFNETVPITVVLTPDNGAPVSYNTSINNSANNPAEVTLDIVLPLNVQTTVHAWTR